LGYSKRHGLVLVEPSTVIIGGGPAGAVAGRLLAAWGHRAVILEKTSSRPAHGLAESIPPSTRKLLGRVGVLEAVDAAGFFQSTGNTVWWGSDECRVESFGDGRPPGLQVYRPRLDRLLLQCAVESGVEVRAGARVRSITLDDRRGRAEVEYEREGRWETLRCEWVLDCSGRSGVLARRFRLLGHRTYALVGGWRAPAWPLPDPSHTVVEAYDHGWAWSVPLSATERQVGFMIDGPGPRTDQGSRTDQGRRPTAQRPIEAYHAELGRATQLRRHLRDATLDHAWACDASTYSSSESGGRNFLLVGDAGSFVDPLSSFGVKKAVGSAWMAAVVVNTCLRHRDRQAAAIELFSSWERDVNATTAERSREFALAASARFPHPFWTARAAAAAERGGVILERRATSTEPPAMTDERSLRDALRQIQATDDLDLALNEAVAYEQRAVIRDREVVLEDAFPSGVRFKDNVDLMALARLAGRYRQLPDLCEAYRRSNGPASLASVVGGLSLLVAKGFLIKKDVMRC
jgi:flavin-dependent dehydrogenase